jgi:hypothetical protein
MPVAPSSPNLPGGLNPPFSTPIVGSPNSPRRRNGTQGSPETAADLQRERTLVADAIAELQHSFPYCAATQALSDARTFAQEALSCLNRPDPDQARASGAAARARALAAAAISDLEQQPSSSEIPPAVAASIRAAAQNAINALNAGFPGGSPTQRFY